MIIVLSAFFHVLGINCIYAQSMHPAFRVKGLIVDSLSGKAISFVTIQVQTDGSIIQGSLSDESGNFSILLIASGKYDFLFHSVGYQQKKLGLIQVKSDSVTDIGIIALSAETTQLTGVTVSSIKPLVRNEGEKLVYSVESDPESKTDNVLGMLRKVPFVTVDGDDNVKLRGASGVKILINGKSSIMLDKNTKDVLRNMPSNSVKDIEVITNPSSKYEAEGSAGIINIITMRKVSEGYIGKVNAGVNSTGSYNGNVYFASKANKLVYSLNAVANHFESPLRFSGSTRQNYSSMTDKYTVLKWTQDGIGNWNSLNGEASYEIDSMNLVSLSFNGDFAGYSGNFLSTTKNFDSMYSATSWFDKKGKFTGDWTNFTGTFDYQKLFRRKDRALVFSYRYERSLNDEGHNDKFAGLLNFPDYWQKVNINGDNLEQTLQLDYVNPIGKKSQLETGFKQIWRKNNTITAGNNFDEQQNTWVPNSSGSNNLDYTQSVLGIYMTYQLKYKKGLYKAGLRAENTVNQGLFKAIKDTAFTNKMFTLVPYLLFSMEFDKGKSLNLSYTKRLARPGIWYLNPYYDNTDPRNIIMGNPQLETEVSNNIDFSFNKFTEKFNFSLNLTASFSDNLISDVSVVRTDGVKVTTYKNIGNDHMAGGSVYSSIKVTDKIHVDATAGANYRNIKSNNNTGLRNSGWSYNGNFNLKLNPYENSTLLAGAEIYSRSIDLQGTWPRWIGSYVTWQQDFLKKKLRLETRLDSPFSKYIKSPYQKYNQYFDEKLETRYPARFLSIKLAFNFGQMKEQVKKTRQSIRNDDLKKGG